MCRSNTSSIGSRTGSGKGSFQAGPAPLEPDSETAMKLPDPFDQDLSPWLMRRLLLAAGLARGLRAEARNVLRT